MKARKLLIAGSLAAAALGVAGPAVAQTDYVGSTGEEVLGQDLSRNPGAAAPASNSGTSGSLPVTGGDVLGLTVIGAAAIGTGAVLVRRSRRTADAPAQA